MKQLRTTPNMRGKSNTIYERYYEIILYRIDDVIKLVNIIGDEYEYAYIMHDNDFKDDATRKKTHWHFLIKYEREKSINAVAQELELSPNQIQWKADWNLSLQYLIHKNDISKSQYNIDDIVSNVQDLYERIYPKHRTECYKQTELQDIALIIDFISEYPRASIYEILMYCIDNGIYATFRRSYHIIKDMRLESRGRNEYYSVILNGDELAKIESISNQNVD